MYLSIITRITVYPLDFGSLVIKFIEMDFQAASGEAVTALQVIEVMI
jgi:hypothetical protein